MQVIPRNVPLGFTMQTPGGGELSFHGCYSDGPVELMAWGPGRHTGARVGYYSTPTGALVAALNYLAESVEGNAR